LIKILPKSATAFEYLPGDSVIHRLAPLPKLLLLAATSVIAFRVEAIPALFVIAFIFLCLFRVAGIPSSCVRRDLTPLIFQLVMTLPLALLSKGLNASALRLIISTTLRFFMMVASVSLVVRTTGPWKLFEALKPALGERMALLGLLAVRYVPILSSELKEISQVQELRSPEGFPGGIRGFLLRGASLLIPYAQRSLRKAEEIAIAAQARGMARHG